eukprot:TRINITY_DN822_c0_g1_i5.p1 TRINITY_DN822_c0_g1~~TRINITY_DN822_c0_g1_i5.p1  ORF type:complete len:387 (-),score=72.72 TRINITY_DN822_c0_g1_i5:43-1203(-)
MFKRAQSRLFLRYKYFLKNGDCIKLHRKSIEHSVLCTTFYQNDHIFTWSKIKYGDKADSEKGERMEKSKRKGKEKVFDKTTTETKTTEETSPRAVFESEPLASSSSSPSFPKISIIEGDCLEVARWLKKTHRVNPCLLNNASSTKAGGGYRNGTSSQEESLHRCTNLFHCLEDPYQIDTERTWSYPIPEFGAIFSPDVLVIRKCEQYGYEFLSSPEKISIVSASAYSSPPIETNSQGEVVISKKIANATKQKMTTILNVCLENGHDSVVLSAFGCGVYRNPATHIARLWKEVLNTQVTKDRKVGTFLDHFKLVVFAIVDQRNEINCEGTLMPFAKEFNIEPIKLHSLLGVDDKIEKEEEEEGEGSEEDKGEEDEFVQEDDSALAPA